MDGTRRLDRLTASDLFLLLWDDYGWSTDIGGLAILDGTSLFDEEGRVRIDTVRRHLEPTTSESTRLPRRATRISCCRHASSWPAGRSIPPARCGIYGCCPGYHTDGSARS